ncbi:hypothetical protein LVJ94_51770 [Pendulispora rubella]|uniref:Uncharacterized protein n=1 Tax=Pendulispora rubella TaxID=2741070 RepID=A0ABZ2L341_9BACT
MNRKPSSAPTAQPPLAPETEPARFGLEPRARKSRDRGEAMPVPLFLAAAASTQGLEWRYG